MFSSEFISPGNFFSYALKILVLLVLFAFLWYFVITGYNWGLLRIGIVVGILPYFASSGLFAIFYFKILKKRMGFIEKSIHNLTRSFSALLLLRPIDEIKKVKISEV